ncbi:MAG: hypothetical protein IPJ26_17200 [Bacteroidetes bacterium]|nr:hypothetical protein [Bacteroidota bacterium]
MVWTSTPDLPSVILVTLIQVSGTILLHQKCLRSGLFSVDKLIGYGVQIICSDPHRLTVIGLARKHPPKGIQTTSPGYTGSIALLTV